MESPDNRQNLSLKGLRTKLGRRNATFHPSASQPVPARTRKSGSLVNDRHSSSEEVNEKEDYNMDGGMWKKVKVAKRLSEVEDPPNALWRGQAGKGDVKLISKDAVEFVVPQYWLQASSVRLRKVLEEGGLDPMESVTGVIRSFAGTLPFPVVHIDVSSIILSDFLLLASHNPHFLSLDRLKRVYTLSKSLDSPSVLQATSHAIHTRHARASPWSAFLLSAEMGDVQAAKACLRQMAYDKQHRDLDLKDLYPAMMDGLDMRWMCALVRCLSIHPHVETHDIVMVNTKKWDLISEDFKL